MTAEEGEAGIAAWVRRFIWPLGITFLLFVGWLSARDAVAPVLLMTPYGLERLVRPPMYSVLAPLSDVLDALSLLSVPQLIAFAASLIGYYVLWRMVRWRRRGTSAWCEFCAGLRALLILALVVIFAAVLPRPMAALRSLDPNAVIFDIHSHTNFSHDARSTFTVEANRAWHHDAGFDVAYITDHRCFDGAAEGMRANPKRAGDGAVLLSGIELPPDESHLVVLEPPDSPAPASLFDPWCVRAGTGKPLPRGPVRIQTIPETFNRLRIALASSDTAIIGIEISDGAPRGIAQAHTDRALIEQLAVRHRLAMLAGSNNHGWGHTAVAWNVMRIPGWRELAPDSLGRVIEMRLRTRRDSAVDVIERRSVPGANDRVDKIISYPLMPLRVLVVMLTTISGPERLWWLAWTWGIAGIVLLVRRRRT